MAWCFRSLGRRSRVERCFDRRLLRGSIRTSDEAVQVRGIRSASAQHNVFWSTLLIRELASGELPSPSPDHSRDYGLRGGGAGSAGCRGRPREPGRDPEKGSQLEQLAVHPWREPGADTGGFEVCEDHEGAARADDRLYFTDRASIPGPTHARERRWPAGFVGWRRDLAPADGRARGPAPSDERAARRPPRCVAGPSLTTRAVPAARLPDLPGIRGLQRCRLAAP